MAIISNATTILDAGSFASGAVNSGQVLIKELTASSSATLSFVHGSSSVVFDGTYPIYVFKFINIHPATYQAKFTFQADTSTNTNYNQTMTTTWFYAGYHKEDGSGGSSGYFGDADQAQGTSFQNLTWSMDNGNDDNCNGTLTLFNPSSTTFIKHFMCNTQFNYGVSGDATELVHCSGYFNITDAINKIQFKMSSGNIDAGTIKMYGIKDS